MAAPPSVDIPSLTGLRAIAAGWVVLHHFRQPLLGLAPGLKPVEPLLNHGYLGVEIFFVLSGFIISHNYATRFAVHEPGLLRRYLWARVARIYPVHLATLLVMAALVIAAGTRGVTLSSESRNTPMNFVANVLMLQAAPGLRPFNWPAWSVCCELAAYLAFAGFAYLLPRLNRGAALSAAAGAAITGVAGVWALTLAGEGWSLSYPMMWWRITFGFVTGCLLWSWWRRGVSRSGWWDLLAIAAAAASVIVLSTIPPGESPFAFAIFPLLAVFVVSCASASGLLARALSSTWMLWGGRVSYSLYMTHFIVFLVVKKLAWWDQFAAASLPTRIGVLIGYATAVTMASVGAYYVVEEPGRRAIRRWTAGSPKAATTT